MCREAATIAVREYVHAADDESASVDDIVLTMAHFEAALHEVDAGVDAADGTTDFGESGEPIGADVG